MRAYWKYLLFILVIILIVAWIAGVFRKRVESTLVKTQPKKVTGLKIAKVEAREISEIPYVGVVEAEERAEISTRVMAKVLAVKVKEGDCVRKGDLLVLIEGEDVHAQIESIEHRIKQAEAEYRASLSQHHSESKTFERYTKLIDEGAVTPQEFDEIKARYEASKERVAQARAGITALKAQRKAILSTTNYLYLRAPFSGCVIRKFLDKGDLTTPGQTILVLEKAPFKARIDLPSQLFDRVRVGQEFDLLIESLDLRIRSKVVKKTPSVDPKSKTFSIWLLLSKDGLRSGETVKFLFPDRRKALWISIGAVLHRFDFTGVYVVKDDGILELRYVKLGERRDNEVEVLSGIREGERIIIEGIDRACDGCQVE
ncbi:MAG: efflux RND transporter periplasmic adaptor subunit [Caldimicrobium sp.]|nr:efflux RND transporter periplasmic adaptor subunit [Caldimicrobium sp.]MCX7613574.1 efflux RND transporter periplasmic adaptor subunit [Caldimicrobium sp.]MDW8182334.1 efflux RND transporter periplasmic adaptor subunit [Caldimicrobium sp.]